MRSKLCGAFPPIFSSLEPPFQFPLCGTSLPIFPLWRPFQFSLCGAPPSFFLLVEPPLQFPPGGASLPIFLLWSLPSNFPFVEPPLQYSFLKPPHQLSLPNFLLWNTEGKENRKVDQLYDLLLMVWKKKTRNRKVGLAFKYL